MKPLRSLKFSSKNLCLTWLRKNLAGHTQAEGCRHPSSKRSIVPMKRVPSSCLGNPSIRWSPTAVRPVLLPHVIRRNF